MSEDLKEEKDYMKEIPYLSVNDVYSVAIFHAVDMVCRYQADLYCSVGGKWRGSCDILRALLTTPCATEETCGGSTIFGWGISTMGHKEYV